MSNPIATAEAPAVIPRREGAAPRLNDHEVRSFEQLLVAADAVALARRRGIEEMRAAALEQGVFAEGSAAHTNRALVAAVAAITGTTAPSNADAHALVSWLVEALSSRAEGVRVCEESETPPI